MDLVTCTDVALGFGRRAFVEHISFTLPPGAVLTVTGSNGAGKSTLLRAIAGLVKPLSGRISLQSSKVAYLGHSLGLVEGETVERNIRLFANLACGDGRRARLLADETINKFDLAPVAHRPLCTLSRGTACRVALARVAVSKASVSLLDEPTHALDVTAVQLCLNLIRDLVADGGSVVVATHDPRLLDPKLCSRTLSLVEGRAVLGVSSH